jgi:hypothetical protein
MTTNEYCIPGRFWTTIPARERSAQEVEALRELAALVEEEAKEDADALAKWVG